MGADVIKVEPPEGDMTRYSFPRVNSIATYFTQQNCGKRNISLDLRQPRAVELLRELARRSHVVLENFRPGVMDRMGLGYEALAAEHPDLVYASLTGYGSTGPWAHRRAVRARRRRGERPDLAPGRGSRWFLRQRSHLPRRRVPRARVPRGHPRRARTSASGPAAGSTSRSR